MRFFFLLLELASLRRARPRILGHHEIRGLLTASPGILLSIGKSRYSLPVQFGFLVMNAVGILLSTIYNASTPDLYPNNAHHKLGWVVTWFMCAKVFMEMISAYSGHHSKENVSAEERAAFIPISTENMDQFRRMHGHVRGHSYRYSNDSGHGTDANTASLRSQSISSIGEDENPLRQQQISDDEEDIMLEKEILTRRSRMNEYLEKKVPVLFTTKALKVLRFTYNVIDRTILPLGFTALATGVITYSGIFVSCHFPICLQDSVILTFCSSFQMGHMIFNGLAHWIKGGIFFWYGILTLGRWGGAFVEIGWVS